MARTPRLPTEYVTANDGYDIVFRRAGVAAADRTWTAQARVHPDDTLPTTTFELTATDGTGEHAGKAIINLHLDGAVTLALPRSVQCDLQETAPGLEPLTIARWRLVVEPQITSP